MREEDRPLGTESSDGEGVKEDACTPHVTDWCAPQESEDPRFKGKGNCVKCGYPLEKHRRWRNVQGMSN